MKEQTTTKTHHHPSPITHNENINIMMIKVKMPMATIIKTIQGNTHQLLRRQMSSTAKVWVDKNTRVICQGFTGKQVSRKIEFQ